MCGAPVRLSRVVAPGAASQTQPGDSSTAAALHGARVQQHSPSKPTSALSSILGACEHGPSRRPGAAAGVQAAGHPWGCLSSGPSQAAVSSQSGTFSGSEPARRRVSGYKSAPEVPLLVLGLIAKEGGCAVDTPIAVLAGEGFVLLFKR